MTYADVAENVRNTLAAIAHAEDDGRAQRHLVVNTVVTDWDRDHATATSDVVVLVRADSGWFVAAVGRYDDTFVNHDGSWLLRSREVHFPM